MNETNENAERITKTEAVRRAVREADWPAALRIAKTFRRLPELQRLVIGRAHDALHHPRFYEQVGQSPAVIVGKGVAMLQAIYGEPR